MIGSVINYQMLINYNMSTTASSVYATTAATNITDDYKFKNVYERRIKEEIPSLYHESKVIQNIWSSKYFKNHPSGAKSGFNIQMVLSDKMAMFMGVTQASHVECTKAFNVYVKEHKLQNPANTRIINPDAKLTILLGPFDEKEGLTYFNLQKYLSKHMLKRANCSGPKYAPTPELTNFITKTAIPRLNDDIDDYDAYGSDQSDSDEYAVAANEDKYKWDSYNFNKPTPPPIEEELQTVDAVAPTVILDYINAKKLRKVTVTVAYDKPLYDMLGLNADNTLSYDRLASLLRAKMYPEVDNLDLTGLNKVPITGL